MPTYEHRCRKCGHEFEVFKRISEPPVKNCPKCRRRGCVELLISGGSGLLFKGSGFYITDYKRKGKPDNGSAPKSVDKAAGGDKPSGEKSATGKSGSSDS